MKVMKFAAVAATIALVGGFSFEAEAATCKIADVQYSSACIGRTEITSPPGPGGSASEDDVEALAGGGWTELAKVEEGVTSSLFAFDIGSLSGSYTIFSPTAGFDYAVALKGGAEGGGTKFFAAYLLSAADILANLNIAGNLAGTFNMDAFAGLTGAGGSTPGLSNVVLFQRAGEEPPPEVIPLPAAGWLLLAGVGGLAAMRRRKNAA